MKGNSWLIHFKIPKTQITVKDNIKIKKIQIAEYFAVIIIKVEQFGFTIEYNF